MGRQQAIFPFIEVEMFGLEFGGELGIWRSICGHRFSKEFCAPEVGEELACLSTLGRQSKRRVHGRCKD